MLLPSKFEELKTNLQHKVFISWCLHKANFSTTFVSLSFSVSLRSGFFLKPQTNLYVWTRESIKNNYCQTMGEDGVG